MRAPLMAVPSSPMSVRRLLRRGPTPIVLKQEKPPQTTANQNKKEVDNNDVLHMSERCNEVLEEGVYLSDVIERHAWRHFKNRNEFDAEATTHLRQFEERSAREEARRQLV